MCYENNQSQNAIRRLIRLHDKNKNIKFHNVLQACKRVSGRFMQRYLQKITENLSL